MVDDDVTLQELIVRALTGRDQQARKSLDAAAASDPELQRFCAELDEVVTTLAGSTSWRAAPPSPELTAMIRQAVISRLPAAPPHFRTVMLEADLGRRRARKRLVLWVLLGLVLLAAAIYVCQRPPREGERLRLTGKAVFDAPLKGEPLNGWEFVTAAPWNSAAEGLRAGGATDVAALHLKDGFDCARALAFNVDLRVVSLDDETAVTVFLADAQGGVQPLFGPAARPRAALELDITADGMFLYGPSHALLQSQPAAIASGMFMRVRMEYLGQEARVLVNGKVLFEGALPRPLQGPLYPGMRVTGPKKNEIAFNSVRVER
ncbi:MAG: hypothetical protein NTW87_33710 [Planctomycetota bacterium]|nr:hypothetical protein [Planctomycetota bacterium]